MLRIEINGRKIEVPVDIENGEVIWIDDLDNSAIITIPIPFAPIEIDPFERIDVLVYRVGVANSEDIVERAKRSEVLTVSDLTKHKLSHFLTLLANAKRSGDDPLAYIEEFLDMPRKIR